MKVLLIAIIALFTLTPGCNKLDETNPEEVLSKYMDLRFNLDFKAAYNLLSSDSKQISTLGEYIKYFETPDSLKPLSRSIKSIEQVDENINSPSYLRFRVKGLQISHNGDSINYIGYFTLKNEDSKWTVVWNKLITKQAQLSYNKGDYDGALKLLFNATNLDPYDADAFEKIGWCYLRDNTKTEEIRKDEMMKNFKYALMLEPDKSAHYNAMAAYYGFIDMPDLKIESYNKGIQLALSNSDKSSIYSNLAQCYVDKYQPDKALEFLDKSIDCYPNSTFAYYKYGVILKNEGNYEEAKEKYEKALSLPVMENALQSNLYYSYAQLCYIQYEYQKAKEYILKAIDMDPNNETYHDLYERINYHTGDSHF